ncbi:MAG: hypothetical protein QOC75_445, partial [Pseudonocardiales bacterium]|nr:hypothetical protein [Pseudonocardiales bacterium]
MAQVDLVTGTSRSGGSRRRRWLLVALALAAAALAGEVLYNSSDEVLAA